MKVIEEKFAEKWTLLDRSLLLDADAALQQARLLLREEMLYHGNVQEALRHSELATAKLQKLALQLKGVETPKIGV